MKIYFIITIAAAALITTAVWAQSNRAPSMKKPAVNQASVNACKGLNEGDSCSIKSCKKKNISGTCQKMPRHNVLHCRPNDNNKNKPMRPARGGMCGNRYRGKK
ncbi:hypothetical protein KKF34_16050 [Myxococcota bacterium]|nr:hypothetical protein [Myxococcota bacterium]MBU1380212.1 hypothetical protein [Myxococcota bacterium]MBU1498390.1 hypothetical protein [Myxococcota bacterium]